jgi:hypothetical protein
MYIPTIAVIIILIDALVILSEEVVENLFIQIALPVQLLIITTIIVVITIHIITTRIPAIIQLTIMPEGHVRLLKERILEKQLFTMKIVLE